MGPVSAPVWGGRSCLLARNQAWLRDAVILPNATCGQAARDRPASRGRMASEAAACTHWPAACGDVHTGIESSWLPGRRLR